MEKFGALRDKGEPVCWEGIQKGDKLMTVKKYLKKKQAETDEDLPVLPSSELPIVEQVEQFITSKGIVPAVEGRFVNLANPDSFRGRPATIRQRAEHLITQAADKSCRKFRIPDKRRIPFVPAIPKTVADADLVTVGKHKGNDRIYYFRNYKQGTHLVITDTQGNIIEQGQEDGLLSQYQPNLKKDKFDASCRVSYKKGGFISEAASKALLIPPTAIDSPHSEAATPSESTVALSNPAGVALPNDQTEGVPNNEKPNSNIENS